MPTRPKPPTTDSSRPQSVRLQRALAAAGYGSRRQCEELIVEGRVEVDGKIVDQLGANVDPQVAKIFVDGTPLKPQRLVYFAVNKPTGVVTTNADPEGRARVVDLVPPDERVFPVGRLDRASEGLILLTNDGELAQRLAHPRFEVAKVYRVVVAGSVNAEAMREMRKGIYIAEGLVRVEGAKVIKARAKATEMEITLKEGKNREIRRILARLGHKVQTLKRIAIGPLRLGEMPTGAYRRLTAEELKRLKQIGDPAAASEAAGDGVAGGPGKKPRAGKSAGSRSAGTGKPGVRKPAARSAEGRPAANRSAGERTPAARSAAGRDGERKPTRRGDASTGERSSARPPRGGDGPRGKARPPVPKGADSPLPLTEVGSRYGAVIGADTPPKRRTDRRDGGERDEESNRVISPRTKGKAAQRTEQESTERTTSGSEPRRKAAARSGRTAGKPGRTGSGKPGRSGAGKPARDAGASRGGKPARGAKPGRGERTTRDSRPTAGGKPAGASRPPRSGKPPRPGASPRPGKRPPGGSPRRRPRSGEESES